MSDLRDVVKGAVQQITAAGAERPAAALILGSGLGHIAQRISDASSVHASEIPGYPSSTVEGHDGEFIVGRLEGQPVVALSGRIHGYEGHAPEVLGLPARILCALEPQALVVTNAAGGIREDLRPGDLMLLTDHVNMTGRSPLSGPNHDDWGPRFPDMSEVYPAAWRQRLTAVAEGVPFKEGVYACMPGPQYETPAEIRALRALGVDAVGMSTVPEATIASHMGVPVLGISVISNLAAGMGDTALDHEEVLAASGTAGRELGDVLLRLVATLGDDRR